MPRNRKLNIEIANSGSLQSLMQEVYNNACTQINDAQKVINEVEASTASTEIDDIVKIAKAKTDALKLEESAINLKLNVGKLQSDIIKFNGDMKSVYSENQGIVDKSDFDKIRELIKTKDDSKN